MARPGDNLRTTLTRVTGTAKPDVTGTFRSGELTADFHIVAKGSALFGSFQGFLGQGAMQPIYPIGTDLWRLPCQRSMDAPAPGDWTLHFARDGAGKVTAVTVGCWLARKVLFEKRV
jgi:D-aminopeptidase